MYLIFLSNYKFKFKFWKKKKSAFCCWKISVFRSKCECCHFWFQICFFFVFCEKFQRKRKSKILNSKIMATYAAYRHVELDNVGYGKKRLVLFFLLKGWFTYMERWLFERFIRPNSENTRGVTNFIANFLKLSRYQKGPVHFTRIHWRVGVVW